MVDAKGLLKNRAYQNIPLTFDEAYELGLYALAGCRGDGLAQMQSIAMLCAFHNAATYAWRGEDGRSAASQIAGVCAAIFMEDIPRSPQGFLTPRVPYAMDNCGMGGDLVITANVSTIAAYIAAAAGIPMCKHGSPANADAGRHGSSDFVQMLGVDTYAPRAQVERALETERFAYTEALDTGYKLIHMQTHTVAMLPHMNDVVGPITTPLDPKILTRRVLGVNHLIKPRVLAEAYLILNEKGITHLEHGLFVRGFAEDHASGMDEVSLCEGGTLVAELKDGEIREYWLTAEDFGLEPVPVRAISPPRGMSKGEFSLQILRGQIGSAPAQMVLANAALLLYLARKSSDLKVW